MTDMLGEVGTGDMEKGQGNGKERIWEACLEEVMLSCLLEEELASRMTSKGVPGRGTAGTNGWRPDARIRWAVQVSQDHDSKGQVLGGTRAEARQGGRGHRGFRIKVLVSVLIARGASQLAIREGSIWLQRWH